MKFSFLYIAMFLISAVFYPVTGEVSDIINDDDTKIKLEKARELIESGFEEEALKLYLSILEDNPTQYDALWKTSLIYVRKGRRDSDADKQSDYYDTAKYYAKKAVSTHPDKPRSNYAYAVVALVIAKYMPNSTQRIKLIGITKEHGEKALEMDPSYAPAWHLMGLWHSNISQISRREKLAARIMYGNIPGGASADKAEQYLKKAMELKPSFILFKLDLAQHYQETDQPQKAISVLETIFQMTPISKNDHHEMEEAKERYNQLM